MQLSAVLASRTLSAWSSTNPLLRLGKRVLPQEWRAALKSGLERTLLPQLPVRRHLEREIIPAVVAFNPGRVLFVGVSHYTTHYPRYFRGGCWTIDIDPAQALYGSPERHRIASVTKVDGCFDAGFFAAAFLNGVLGWGLDSAEDQNAAFRALHRVLKPGGLLVVGWDDCVTGDPLFLDAVRTLFRHIPAAGLDARTRFPDFNQRERPGAYYFYDLFTAR